MANEITLKFNSEASWTKDDKRDLLESFADFIREIDDDAVEGSFTIEIVEEGTEVNAVTEAQKKEIIEDFLDNSTFTADVKVDYLGGSFSHLLK